MKPITYSLQADQISSDFFYHKVDPFGVDVLQYIESRMQHTIVGLLRYVSTLDSKPAAPAPAPAWQEYALDWLTLGVLWQCYGDQAEGLHPWKGKLLRRLVGLRAKAASSPTIKAAIVKARGPLNSYWLIERGPSSPVTLANQTSHPPTLLQLRRLIGWLEASGEFKQEVHRLELLYTWLEQLPAYRYREILKECVSCATWFTETSEKELGRYTAGVDSFRLEAAGKEAREDVVQRLRHRVEYHLNLVAAAIMNKLYRKEFVGTPFKALLLPVCMKSRSPDRCAANRQGKPTSCLRCDPSCRIGQLSLDGEIQGYEVHVVPHESDAFSRQVTERWLKERTGIVGVACALNLLSGGWKARSMQLPVQCVILESVGCPHWTDSPIPTDINDQQLRRTVGLGEG